MLKARFGPQTVGSSMLAVFAVLFLLIVGYIVYSFSMIYGDGSVSRRPGPKGSVRKAVFVPKDTPLAPTWEDVTRPDGEAACLDVLADELPKMKSAPEEDE